jgi:WD40 repeat protein
MSETHALLVLLLATITLTVAAAETPPAISTVGTPPKAASDSGKPDGREIGKLIRQLGHDKFREREAASRRLLAIGAPAWDALRKAAADSKDPEIRQRAARLVQALAKRLFAHVRRIAWQDDVQHMPAHIYHTAFAPDGRSYLAGGDVPQLRLWDVATGRQLQEFKGHDGWTSCAAFTPGGKRVLSGGIQDKLLRLWDVKTGRQLRTFAGHTAEIVSVAVSPDGRLALSGSADKTLRLWRLGTGREVRLLEGHAGACGAVFSPDGKRVLSFSADGTLRLWDTATGQAVRVLRGHTGHVAGACFLPGGRRALSWGVDGSLRTWDLADGKELRRHNLGTGLCAIRWLAVTPDGRLFLTNHQDLAVCLRDVATGEEVHRFTMPPGASPQGLSVSPDGRYAADGAYRGFVDLFRLTEAGFGR